jgi:hypothetical protein
MLLSGCVRAPAIDVEGSFFPAWIVCLAIAVPSTFAIRWGLLKLRLESEVGPLALFYPSLVVIITVTLWMGYFK